VRIVGIDPGLAACGYGVVEARGSRVVAAGCYRDWSGPSSVSASIARGDRQEVFLALQEPPFGEAW
jgi:hypothetical protein